MWQQVFDQRILQYDTPLTVDYLFQSSVLIVNAALDKNAAFPFGKRTYKLVGYMFPVFYTSETGLTKGNPRRLYLGKQQIEFSNPFSYTYKLDLHVHLWTSQLDLTIWQSDEELNLEENLKTERIQRSLDSIERKINNIETWGNM